ncbi:MAG: hypothetical protein ACXWBH_00800 [Candidatus Angelobacter sp.]
MSTTAFGHGSACPVQITDIRNVGNTVSVLFRNTSQAEMTKYEFVVWFVDFAGETHFLPVLVARKHLRAGRQSGKLVLPAAELQLSFSLAHAYPLHVSFADGSVWNDDGSHSCSTTALQE